MLFAHEKQEEREAEQKRKDREFVKIINKRYKEMIKEIEDRRKQLEKDLKVVTLDHVKKMITTAIVEEEDEIEQLYREIHFINRLVE